MKTKHSPAPWSIQKFFEAPNTYAPFIIAGPAMVRFPQGYHGAEEDAEMKAMAEANARLIAAAPELLDFALLAKDYLQHPGGEHLPASAWFDLNAKLRAVLSNIEGEEA